VTESELRDAVIGVLKQIAPEADYARLRPDVGFREQLDIDSIDFMNFLVGLHAALGVEVPESDYRRVSTLDDCVRYLSQRGARRN
jgi:acyl carrier protein